MHIHKPQLHHPLAQGREQGGLKQGIRACLAQWLSNGPFKMGRILRISPMCAKIYRKGLEECLWSWQANTCEAEADVLHRFY